MSDSFVILEFWPQSGPICQHKRTVTSYYITCLALQSLPCTEKLVLSATRKRWASGVLTYVHYSEANKRERSPLAEKKNWDYCGPDSWHRPILSA